MTIPSCTESLSLTTVHSLEVPRLLLRPSLCLLCTRRIQCCLTLRRYEQASLNPLPLLWVEDGMGLSDHSRLGAQFNSVQFSYSVVSNSLQPHESQHTRPPCPSLTSGVYPNPCPSSWWCHPTISFSVVPISSCPQSLPASGSFPMSQLFAWGGQSTRVSALTSVLPVNTQDWSASGWTGWISLQSKGCSRVFSNTTVQKYQFFGAQPSSQSNSHIHTGPLEKP